MPVLWYSEGWFVRHCRFEITAAARHISQKFTWVLIWLWTALFIPLTALWNTAAFQTYCVASRGKAKKGLVFVYAFAEVGIWLMPSSRTVSHDVFHLFVLRVNDKRFVAALILNVKPLKQMPERLLEGVQVCSITHPARQPKKLIIKFLLVTHKNQYPWIGWLIAPNMSSCA